MRRATEREAGVVVLVLFIVIIIVAAMGAGWWTWYRHHQHQSVTVPTVSLTTAPVCDPQDLSLSQGGSDGTAGTLYKHAVITNTSSHRCTLTGYPAAFLVDGSNAVLGSGAGPNPLYSPTALSLAAGAKAHTVLGFPDAGAFADPSVCSALSSKLQLYLPGSVTPLTTLWSDKSCPGFSVTALQAGA